MATTNSVQAAQVAAGTLVDGRIQGGKLRRFRFDIVLASQADGDTINLGKKPRGMIFARGFLNSDVSLGASTPAIGIAGSTAKYRAAAVHTTANSPIAFGKTAPTQEAEPAEEDLILTNSTAAFPAAGNLAVEIECSEIG